ncbi:MAG: hypothetical protein OEZ68_08465 [Gammaproteobacteria bacterium]|nr:hypothetical protein [Gammaproteobacteria bacterium]MDH5800821.1 hypothetical protein [Gammaproteobacteria bacterium]
MNIVRVVGQCMVLVLGTMLCVSNAWAGRIADISNTKHNFSTGGPDTLPTGQQRVVKAQAENQICVFCHTPHAANTEVAPLWNRNLTTATYQVYGSTIGGASTSSFDANITQPSGVSKLCLSCHDGTMAIGGVNVLNGSDRNGPIQMVGTGPGGNMAPGDGTTTGFTRYLGTNLTNDHPISVTYDQTLVTVDAEMRNPNQNHIFVRTVDPGRPVTEQVHLEGSPSVVNGGLVQCNSCHDPHIRSTDPQENIKFLRLNRLQVGQGPSTVQVFSPQNDIICLACHEKTGWAGSAHADERVANEVYTAGAAQAREFPAGTQVWQSACLACHDTHTVEGSRRLLREGVDGNTLTLAGNYRIKQGGGQPAIEETCYACHSRDGFTLQGQDRGLNASTFEVPDIKTDFTTMARRMPITTAAQQRSFEVHDIGSANADAARVGDGPNGLGKDFIESAALMGNGNRHVECTDCHNPHRVTKNRLFYEDPVATGPAAAGTHSHTQPHTNLASGVLRGIWGVEPVYTSQSFYDDPSSFNVKRGNPANTVVRATDSPDAVDYVTREYQICFKCHSNYSFGTTPPPMGYNPNLTPASVNNIGSYTNIAREYNSPASHMGEGAAAGGGATGAGANHRSWHPVMRPTGRDGGVRGVTPAQLWLQPFQFIGTQTMYCTDCHGSSTAGGTAVPNGGENGFAWGPHGSNDNFLLKGPWSGATTGGTGAGTPNHLCFKCHNYDQYGTGNGGTGGVANSGFRLGGGMGGMCMGGGMGGGAGGGMMCMMGGGGMGGMAFNNLHVFHNNVVTNFRCNLCHVAIPHGWKNKNFLVNLNDVGAESSNGDRGEIAWPAGRARYVNGPYYNGAVLKIRNFAVSGGWNPVDCGSASGAFGVGWMAATCANAP